LKETLSDKLRSITEDIIFIQRNKNRPVDTTLKFVEDSTLFELSKLESNILNGVITSPPYCNAYLRFRIKSFENATDNSI